MTINPSASLFTFPRFQAFNTAGSPLAGGQLYSYAAGTLTPQATYTDSSLTIPNPNPVILDAFGTASVWLGNNAYKINLLDVNGVQQANFPMDNISSISTNISAGLAASTTISQGQGVVGFNSTLSYPLGTLPGDLSDTTNIINGDALIGVLQPFTGAVARTQHSKNADILSVKDFGAVGDGITDDTAAFVAMFALKRAWYIPYTSSGYLINGNLIIASSGVCDGQLIVKSGFPSGFNSAVAVQICNNVYGQKLRIYGLNVYSTDVRPSPYTAAKTVGILVGPTSTYSGNTPCPGVTLYNCKATRFSVNLQISTFNVTVVSGAYPQGDHNILVYSYDDTYNQVNDVSLIDVQSDSASTSYGATAYALRVGTTGSTYVSDSAQGVNLRVQGCNFDGAPVYIDNIAGVNYWGNYHEVYPTVGVVLNSSLGSGLQCVDIGGCYFSGGNYAIVASYVVNNLEIHQNSYYGINYSAFQANYTELQNFKYWNGYHQTSDPVWGSGPSEVNFNFSLGSFLSQATFSGCSIFSDGLTNGSQLVQNTLSTTNWYQKGMTNDGWQNLNSSTGRCRSGSAVQTAIAGTQAGNLFTFTVPAQALLFNGGDIITSSAGSAIWVKSVNYATGQATLDSTYTGSLTISHSPAYFVGYNLVGNGSPQGAITANPGSRYTNLSGGTGTTTYVKESGIGTNTGWVAK